MKLSEKLAAVEKQQVAEAPAAGFELARRPRKPAARVPSAQSATWDESKRKVHDMVLAEVAPKMASLSAQQLTAEVRTALDRILKRNDVSVSPLERRKFVQELTQDILGYGPLDPLLADGAVTEIMCNGFDEIWVEEAGKLRQVSARFTDETHYRQVIEKIVSAVGRRIDESSPMVDARLPDGSRVNAIIPPLAIHGPVLTVRKFAQDPFSIVDLINFGTISMDASLVLEACVRARLSVLVSGGTGTGKTTTLNVLSRFIPDGERVITIEDAAELQLQQPHVISLEVRPPNAEGAGEVRTRDLVKNSLRMRPDRIIVGECRGPEALDMLQAMNTGHEGSMTTIHANGPRDALSRIETMVLMAGYELPLRAIRDQVASALDVIVQLERTSDGRRVVSAITEVQGMEGDIILLQDVFVRRPCASAGGEPSDELVSTGLRPRFVDRLDRSGVEIPAQAFKAPLRRVPGEPKVLPAARMGRLRVPDAAALVGSRGDR